MSDAITFSIRTNRSTYGDRQKFYESEILMWKGGQVVGMEKGLRRETKKKIHALQKAKARIAELKKHRLFVVPVTKKHISDGDARSCSTCAIAQALWHRQEEMGLSKQEWNFEVSPYGAWVEPRGLVLAPKFGNRSRETRIPQKKLPMVVINYDRNGERMFYGDSMYTWAMQYDDWAESRFQSAMEWRAEHRSRDPKPFRPSPAFFVLDLDEFAEEVK